MKKYTTVWKTSQQKQQMYSKSEFWLEPSPPPFLPKDIAGMDRFAAVTKHRWTVAEEFQELLCQNLWQPCWSCISCRTCFRPLQMIWNYANFAGGVWFLNKFGTRKCRCVWSVLLWMSVTDTGNPPGFLMSKGKHLSVFILTIQPQCIFAATNGPCAH